MQEEKRIKIRFLSWLVVALITYLLFYRLLFWQQSMLGSVIWFLCYFVSVSFFSLDYTQLPIKKSLLLWGVFGIGLSLLLPSWQWQNLLALRVSLGGSVVLVWYNVYYLQTMRVFKARGYFYRSSSVLSWIFTLVFGFAILGNFQELPFGCQEIEHLQDQLGIYQLSSGESSISAEQNGFWASIKQTVVTTKDQLWDTVVDTQKSINHQICLRLYEYLAELYQTPSFQIWFLLVFQVVAYGVLQIVLRMSAVLGVLGYRFGRALGWYRIVEVSSSIERVR